MINILKPRNTTSLLLGFLFSMLLFNCHEGENEFDVGPQPFVEYTIVVLDSSTGAPIGGVEIQLTRIDQTEEYFITDSLTGKVTIPEMESGRNLFSFSKEGYVPLDTIDFVEEKNDSIFNIPILRIFRIRMTSLYMSDQPLVKYTVIVTDAVSGAPLPVAKIRLTTSSLDTATYFTDSIAGRAELDTMRSYRNYFSVSKDGYLAVDTILSVSGENDSIFKLPISEVLRIKLTPLENITADSLQNIQYRILLRDSRLNPLTQGMVTYSDSLGIERIALDENGDGRIIISSLGLGRHLILVEHPDYMGRYLEVEIKRGANDSTTYKFVESFPVSLMERKNSLSGQVFVKASGQSVLPLEGARVVYVLRDSLSVPHSFSAFTNAEGDFVMDSLPQLEGQLEYYLDASASEPSHIEDVSVDALSISAGVTAVVIDPTSGTAGAPVVMNTPPDTVLPQSQLVFKFSQDYDPASVSASVTIVNRGLAVYAPWVQTDSRTLTISLDGTLWEEGVLYQYLVYADNLLGDPFTLPGSKSGVISGYFLALDTVQTVGNVVLPSSYRTAFFYSGSELSFDSLSTNASLLADSSTTAAMLKWEWPGSSSGKRVDSLVLYFRDKRTYSEWTYWMTIPAGLGSFKIFFSEKYSTKAFPSANPVFPIGLPADSIVRLRVVPKEKRTVYFDSAVTLPNIAQGMGPSIYALYQARDSLFFGTQPGRDSVFVTFSFEADPGADTVFAMWDTASAAPGMFLSGQNANVSLEWEWVSEYSGWMKYVVAGNADLRFDYLKITGVANGAVYDQSGALHTEYIWLRNSDDQVVIPGY